MLFSLPDDIWVVDLDSTKLSPPTGGYDEIPPLPEPEGTILKNHLKQASIFKIAKEKVFEEESGKHSKYIICLYEILHSKKIVYIIQT